MELLKNHLWRKNFSIIDAHVHIKTTYQIKNLLEESKRLKIEKMCLLGDVFKYGFNPNEEQIKSINDFTIKLVKKYPQYFIPFCFINPENSSVSVEKEIERFIGIGAKGIKLQCSTNARSKRLKVVMKKAREYNLVILYHCFYRRNNQRILNESTPEDIKYLAEKYPDVKIIIPHLRNWGIKGIWDIKENFNVYVDTSGYPPISGILEYAVETLGHTRIIYGSDVYFPEGRDFCVQIAAIVEAKISQSQKKDILYNNIKKLIGI